MTEKEIDCQTGTAFDHSDRPPSTLNTYACTLGRYQLRWMKVSNSNGAIKCGSHFTAISAHITLTIIFFFRAPKIKQWTLTLSVIISFNGVCKIKSCFFITFTATVCLSVNILLLLLFTFSFHASMNLNTQKCKKLFSFSFFFSNPIYCFLYNYAFNQA